MEQGFVLRDKLKKENVLELMLKYGFYFAFVLVIIAFSLLSSSFFSVGNLFNIIVQAGYLISVSIGMTFVILTSGIDLSVGSVLAFSSVVGATVMSQTQNMYLGIITMLLVGASVGLINGLSVVKLKMPPFIVTFASMNVARGIAFVMTEGKSVADLPDEFLFIGWDSFLGIPYTFLTAIVLFLATNFFLRKTAYGRKLYAVGGSPNASRVMGINVGWIIITAYIFSGFTAGLGGVLMTSRLSAARSVMALGLETDAIAATVIGGTSLTGGKGRLSGTLVGALLIATIRNGLNLLGVSYYFQIVINGAIIFLAATMDRFKAEKS